MKIQSCFLLYVLLLIFGLQVSGCAGPSQQVLATQTGNSGTPTEEKTVQCDYPFGTAYSIPFLVFYNRGMRYISFGPESCRQAFAEKIKEAASASLILPQGCVEPVYKDVDDALHHPEELRKRLNYY